MDSQGPSWCLRLREHGFSLLTLPAPATRVLENGTAAARYGFHFHKEDGRGEKRDILIGNREHQGPWWSRLSSGWLLWEDREDTSWQTKSLLSHPRAGWVRLEWTKTEWDGGRGDEGCPNRSCGTCLPACARINLLTPGSWRTSGGP